MVIITIYYVLTAILIFMFNNIMKIFKVINVSKKFGTEIDTQNQAVYSYYCVQGTFRLNTTHSLQVNKLSLTPKALWNRV